MKKYLNGKDNLDSTHLDRDPGTHRSPSELNTKHQQIINQHVPIGIMECSREGNYIDVNEEFCQMLGYEPEELLQLSLKDLAHEDDYHIDVKLHRQLVAGEIPYYKIERRYVRKNGQIIWVELTRSVVRDANGKVLYTVGTALDITERHLAEEALLRARTRAERSAARLARLQQITAALTGVTTTEEVTAMILEQGTRGVGAAAGILVELLENGQELRTVAAAGYPAAAVRADPEPLSALTPLSECIVTKQAVWISSQEEFAVRYPKFAKLRGGFEHEATVALPLLIGDRVRGGLAFSFVEPRTFEAEECEFFLAVAERCAQALERARAEDALRVSEERLRLATEAARLCAWELNIQNETYTLGENSAQVLGFSPDLLPKTSSEVLQLTPAEDIQAIRQAVAKAVESQGDLRHLQYRLIHPENGKVIWLEVNAKVVYDEQGNPQRMFGMVQNITENKRLEAALLAKEIELEEVINHTPFMLTRCTHDLRYRFVSRAYAEMIGRKPDEIIGQPIVDIMGEEALELISPYIEQVMQGNQVEYETEVPFHGIGLRWLHVVYSPDRDEQGNVVGWFASIVDISQRKRAEESSRANEILYRAIARSIPGGGVYVIDKALRYLVAEGPITKAFELSREVLEGHTVSEIFQGAVRERLEDNLRRAFAGELVSSETTHNGRVYWSQYATMNDALGHAIVVTLDITERKRAEEALRESEERLRAILSQATAGIVRKAFDGTLTFVNDAFCNMLGYTSSELVGRTCWELTHPDDVEENKRLFERLMEYGIPFQLERRLIRRDISVLWFNVSVAPILDASGKPSSAVGVEVDITGRKRAEEALYQLNLELEHRVEERTEELQAANQALQESRRRLQVLTQRLVEVQEEERRALARELHDRVGQSLAALNLNLTIISNQLTGQATELISMRLADSMQLVAEVIALVRDVMSNLRPSILDDYGLEPALQTHLNEFKARYGIQTRFEKPNFPVPRLDTSIEMTLLRIAQEALTNIARHAQADLAVLSLQVDEKQVCLTVSDNGAGINPLHDPNRPSSHGLKIMRERAEALGGQLHVASTPGNGTTIEAVIPLPSGGQQGSSQEKQT